MEPHQVHAQTRLKLHHRVERDFGQEGGKHFARDIRREAAYRWRMSDFEPNSDRCNPAADVSSAIGPALASASGKNAKPISLDFSTDFASFEYTIMAMGDFGYDELVFKLIRAAFSEAKLDGTELLHVRMEGTQGEGELKLWRFDVKIEKRPPGWTASRAR